MYYLYSRKRMKVGADIDKNEGSLRVSNGINCNFNFK